MDKILKKAQELKNELDNLPLFIEYKRVKNLYDNNVEINELKKQIVRARNEGRMNEHKLLLDRLHNDPLYLNYTKLEEEVIEYYKEISNILNKK